MGEEGLKVSVPVRLVLPVRNPEPGELIHGFFAMPVKDLGRDAREGIATVSIDC